MSQPITTQYDPIHQAIRLEQCDHEIIQTVAQQRGLGKNGFDTALRLIIREWLEMQAELPGAAFPGARASE